jgi:cell division protein FtsA
MNPDAVAVLDIGSSKITCLVATRGRDGDVEVLAGATVPSAGISRGVITDPDVASGPILEAVSRVAHELDEEIAALLVSVNGTHLRGHSAQGLKPIVPKGRLISRQDVLEVINHSRSIEEPEREQFQVLPREFKVDGTQDVHEPIGIAGGRLEVLSYIATGESRYLRSVEQALQKVGLTVDQMVLAPLASGIGVLTQDEMESGCAVVDIGEGTTGVGVFHKGSLAYAAVVPVGSGHVSKDISLLVKTSPEEAERLKIAGGCALAKLVDPDLSVDVTQLGQTQTRPFQANKLSEIIESRMREIAKMVKRELEASGLRNMLASGVILTGGGSALKGSEALFDQVLGSTRVRLAEPTNNGSLQVTRQDAVAIGLARFAIQCYNEVEPADGLMDWKGKVKSLFSLISGR